MFATFASFPRLQALRILSGPLRRLINQYSQECFYFLYSSLVYVNFFLVTEARFHLQLVFVRLNSR